MDQKTPAVLLAEVLERRENAMRALQHLRESWASAHRWDAQVSDLRRAASRGWTRFADFYDFVPMPFLVLDERLRVVQANEAAVGFMMPAKFSDLPFVGFVARDSTKAVLDRLPLMPAGHVEALEVQLRAHRGVLPAQMIVRVARNASARDGERLYNVAILDLSEIQRLEAERRCSSEAERAARAEMRAKDEFIAMLSHELRTPLAPIANAAETLGMAALEGPLGEAVSAIRRNVRVEARLIDDLLDAARVAQRLLKVERRPLSLHELLRDVVNDWVRGHDGGRLHLRLELHASREVVEGDAGRLAQVMRNLLVNAAKFTPAGGSITVRTEDAEDRLRLSVIDSGQGMTAEELGHVFEAFKAGRPTRGGRAGLGLGLAISRGIVDAHQGQIRAESPGPDQGTCIEIELPSSPLLVERAAAESEPVAARGPEASAAGPAAPARAEEAAPDQRLGVRVLVVDDHKDSAETLALVLEMTGYDVNVAHSVHEAEEQANGCDVLISDISLPDGSGLELVKTLQRKRKIPAIALSGYGTEQDRQKSLKAGFAEHLTKPVPPARLIDAVRRVSSHPQA